VGANWASPQKGFSIRELSWEPEIIGGIRVHVQNILKSKISLALKIKSRINLWDEALKRLNALWQIALWFAKNQREAESLIWAAYIEASRFRDQTTSRLNIRLQMFKALAGVLARDFRPNDHSPLITDFDNLFEPHQFDSISAISSIPPIVINSAIRSLPAEIRLVIVLASFEKLSYLEIAEIVGNDRKTFGPKNIQRL